MGSPARASLQLSCRGQRNSITEKKKLDFQKVKEDHPQSTYIYRVPQCMSPRRNWVSPTSSLASECAPTPGTKGGGGTRLRERRWGRPNSDDWRKGLALCLLCGFGNDLYRALKQNILFKMWTFRNVLATGFLLLGIFICPEQASEYVKNMWILYSKQP